MDFYQSHLMAHATNSFPNLALRLAHLIPRRTTHFVHLQEKAIVIDVCISTFERMLTRYVVAPCERQTGVGASLLRPLLKAAKAATDLLQWAELDEAARNINLPMDLWLLNAGSAPQLRGNVAVGHIFCGTLQQRWSKSQQGPSMDAAMVATNWLVKEAELRDVHLAFSHLDLGILTLAPNDLDDITRFRKRIDSLAQERGLDLANADARCVILHVMGGTVPFSFAVPARWGYGFVGCDKAVEHVLEFAVIEENQSPAVFAHELLHLFGADDAYSDSSLA